MTELLDVGEIRFHRTVRSLDLALDHFLGVKKPLTRSLEIDFR